MNEEQIRAWFADIARRKDKLTVQVYLVQHPDYFVSLIYERPGELLAHQGPWKLLAEGVARIEAHFEEYASAVLAATLVVQALADPLNGDLQHLLREAARMSEGAKDLVKQAEVQFRYRLPTAPAFDVSFPGWETKWR